MEVATQNIMYAWSYDMTWGETLRSSTSPRPPPSPRNPKGVGGHILGISYTEHNIFIVHIQTRHRHDIDNIDKA